MRSVAARSVMTRIVGGIMRGGIGVSGACEWGFVVAKFRISDCIRCGKHGSVDVNGLCQAACKKWVGRHRGEPDVDYMVWLLRDRVWEKESVPHEILLPMIELGVEVCGTLQELSERIGTSVRRIYGVRSGQNGSYKMGANLAQLLGCSDWFETQVCQIGRAGWSESATYCGENTELRGCGTFYHDHYRDNVCEECYTREMGGDGVIVLEPRDVRLARMRGMVKAG